MRYFFLPLVALSLFSLTPAFAAEEYAQASEEANVDFVYPLTIRRPTVQNELEFGVRHEKGREGRETELAAELGLRPLSRWQVELGIPAVFLNPREEKSRSGLGDITLENTFLIFKSAEHKTQVTTGFEVTLPSGSKHRGLGGTVGVEPFLAGGIQLGHFDLLGGAAYEWGELNAHHAREREQELTVGGAVAYELTRYFKPLLELTTVRKTHGEDEEDGPKLRGKQQLYLTPGFNFRALGRLTLRFGVQLPVTRARESDYRLHSALTWFF
jgi:hypothetical protein